MLPEGRQTSAGRDMPVGRIVRDLEIVDEMGTHAVAQVAQQLGVDDSLVAHALSSHPLAGRDLPHRDELGILTLPRPGETLDVRQVVQLVPMVPGLAVEFPAEVLRAADHQDAALGVPELTAVVAAPVDLGDHPVVETHELVVNRVVGAGRPPSSFLLLPLEIIQVAHRLPP